MAERLIRESDVLENIDEWLETVGYATIGKNLSYYAELKGCIEDAPTIEAKPVVHAHWIEQEYGDLGIGYTCSNCKEDWVTLEGTPSDNLWKYCHACGAQMDEVVE